MSQSYINEVKLYLASRKRQLAKRLFPYTRQAADQRLRKAVSIYTKVFGEDALAINISAHTFRHSFAVNCVVHGAPLPMLQTWLGHQFIGSTTIYTQVLAPEATHVMNSIEF